MELEQYREFLEFVPEYELTSAPLKIDIVVIKKLKDVAIKKNIARIFRSDNIVEFKSPTDYISVEDFYQVYGYACLYLTKGEEAKVRRPSVTDLTITFVESHYPRDLIAHLERVRGYKVEKTAKGIYTVSGDIIPIQIINTSELSAEENFGLLPLCS
jgi:hypothetical protein